MQPKALEKTDEKPQSRAHLAKRTFSREINKDDLMKSVLLSRKKTTIKLVG